MLYEVITPRALAAASLSSWISPAMTLAPIATPIMIAERPTPPQPWTASHSPLLSLACASNARNAVTKRQPRSYNFV